MTSKHALLLGPLFLVAIAIIFHQPIDGTSRGFTGSVTEAKNRPPMLSLEQAQELGLNPNEPPPLTSRSSESSSTLSAAQHGGQPPSFVEGLVPLTPGDDIASDDAMSVESAGHGLYPIICTQPPTTVTDATLAYHQFHSAPPERAPGSPSSQARARQSKRRRSESQVHTAGGDPIGEQPYSPPKRTRTALQKEN